MALFVDGPAATIDDLTDQDSALLEVAQSNAVNLTTKLRLAMDEIRTDLELWLLKPRPTWADIRTPGLSVGQIVTTAALRRWEALRTLELVYRDVYFTQVVDRYQAKWQGYAKLAADARESYLAGGMGLVREPLPKAPAPVLSSVVAPYNGGAFYASVAWVNQAGQEGEASAASSIMVGDGHAMSVAAAAAPSNAVGFRVYAGSSLDQMHLQNATPVQPGGTFTYVPGQVTSGPTPGRGQKPDFIRPAARTLLRG